MREVHHMCIKNFETGVFSGFLRHFSSPSGPIRCVRTDKFMFAAFRESRVFRVFVACGMFVLRSETGICIALRHHTVRQNRESFLQLVRCHLHRAEATLVFIPFLRRPVPPVPWRDRLVAADPQSGVPPACESHF